LKNTEKEYSIFPHIAEEGLGYNNFPFKKAEQLKRLDPDITSRIISDERGDTTLSNKSNWLKFLAWIKQDIDTGSKFFYKTNTIPPVYRAVVFTHGHFLIHNLHIKPVENNDVIYAKIDVANKNIVETKKLTNFSFPKELKSDITGCRIKSALGLLNPFGKKTRKGGRRKNRTRKHMYRQVLN
jgi:hypothetical protein